MKKIIKKPLAFFKKMSKKKKVLLTVIAVVLIVAIVVTLVIRKPKNTIMVDNNSVQSTNVTKGNISNTIVGTGTLEEDDSVSISIPSGITIKSVEVESGDTVKKGDVLAYVDTTSVLEAIEELQEDIEELDEKINDCKDSDETTTVKAKVAGTVKKVYAKVGADVTDCIADNGALVVIAVNGKKSQTIDITASGGTISKVNVSKGDTVSEGDSLVVIKNDTQSVEYKKYMTKRKNMAQSLKSLLKISKKGVITAESDGTIGDVNVSEGNQVSTSQGTQNSGTAAKMSYGSTANSKSTSVKATVSKTTKSVSKIDSEKTAKKATGDYIETTSLGGVMTCLETNISNTDTKLSLQIVQTGKTTMYTLVIATPKTGSVPLEKIENTDDSYTGTIKWNKSVQKFEEGTTYSADITLTANDGYIFNTDTIAKIEKGLVSGISVSEDNKTLSFKITFPETEKIDSAKNDTADNNNEKNGNTNNSDDSKKNNTQDDKNNGINNTNNTELNNNTNQKSGTNTGAANKSTTSETNNSSTAASVSTTTLSSSTEDSYSDLVTAFTMSTDETMLMSVSVDELDINSVEKEQQATVTLDAIENKTFTGKVTKVGNSATSSSGGVSKYTVVISITKDEQMKVGMNASATIVIESRENVLTLPVSALQERGNRTYVYTKKDSDGNLSGEVDITTGLSDGDNVEITEGLTEGETVYYNRKGNISSGQGGMSEGGFGGDFGGGNMPDGNFGGEKPDGMPGGNMNSGGPGGQGGNDMKGGF